MRIRDIPFETAKAAKRESKHIEFKEEFDISQAQHWCEIIKDIVAIANSGGGWIFVGAKKDGSPSEWDATPVVNLDPAQVTDKVARYTQEQFSGFDILKVEKNGCTIAAIRIEGVPTPLVFTLPGTYDIGGGKQKTAFGRGTVYFRHGAKSETGNSTDVRECLNRELQQLRKSWLGGIRKVVTAPKGFKVAVLPKEVVESPLPNATPIRFVDDPSAPVYRKINPDMSHPHRLKEVVAVVNIRLSDRKKITPHDILCVRKTHNIDESKPLFFYKSKFMSPQYSDAFVNWMVEQFSKDNQFFDEARQKCKERLPP